MYCVNLLNLLGPTKIKGPYFWILELWVCIKKLGLGSTFLKILSCIYCLIHILWKEIQWGRAWKLREVTGKPIFHVVFVCIYFCADKLLYILRVWYWVGHMTEKVLQKNLIDCPRSSNLAHFLLDSLVISWQWGQNIYEIAFQFREWLCLLSNVAGHHALSM